MGWRGTVLLALVLAGVGALVWFQGSSPERRSGRRFDDPVRLPTQPIRRLVNIVPGDVTGVRIMRKGERRQAERTDSGWRGADNPTIVNDFLHNLTQLGILMDIPSDPAGLADYGLKPPQSEVSLQLRTAGPPLVLQIGDRNPSTTGVYVRVGENGPAVLAGALVAWEVDKLFNALAAER